jgi:MFS family permease
MRPNDTPAPSASGPQTFRALRHRDFRVLWVGLVVSAVGTWMQIIAQSLLVLRITHGSAIALGVVSLAQALAFFLFAFVGGAVADRVDKRRLLLVTQSVAALLALILGVLALTGLVQVWMIVLLAFCSGTVLSFDQPTRSALIPLLVPGEDLMNAISLQSVIFNGASVVGPALGGIAVGLIGIPGNFFLNALSFLGVLVALWTLKVPAAAAAAATDRRGPFIDSVRAALETVAKDPVLPWLLSGYGALLFLGPSAALLLPIFATQILHLDAIQLGFLFTASGLGTIVGALTIASLGDVKRKGQLVLGALLLWSVALAIFGVSRVLPLSIVGLALYGFAQNGVAATTATLLQTRVPPQMRGRVMSLNTLLIMGVRPLGDFPAGFLISAIGAPPTVLVSAVLVGAYTLYLVAARPAVREV